MREIITFEAKGGALPFLAMDFAMKRLIALLFILVTAMGYGTAQIGYQVALINNATGEPRALETVAVDVEITNSAGDIIATSRHSATTNELGLLSLTVGDSDTFANVDWTKLPLYISATVDGTLIGKTQILSVPVAEYAKHTGELTVDKLCSKTWKQTFPSDCGNGGTDTYSITFSKNGTGSLVTSIWRSKIDINAQWYTELETTTTSFKWHKSGNLVYCINKKEVLTIIYIPSLDTICSDDWGFQGTLFN